MPDFATLQQIDQGAPPPGALAMSNSYPMVPPHPSPDGSGGMTNLSDADYAKLKAGIQAPPTPAGNGAAIDVAGAKPVVSPAFAKFQAADAASEAAVKTGPQPAAPVVAGSLPKMTGYVANVGAAGNEAIAGLLGMPFSTVNSILNLVPRGINAAAGTNIPLLPTNQAQTIENAMGPFNPQNVVPGSPNEALARSIARGADSVALGGVAGGLAAPVATGIAAPIAESMASGATPAGAAIGGVGGAVGHGARAAVPPEYGDVADMLGNIVGGVGAAGTAAGLTAAGRIGASAFQRMRAPLSIGTQQPLANPETGQPFTDQTGTPLAATAGQQQLAAGQIANAARMAPGDLAAAIPPAGSGVPGSTLSVGQQTGNLGVLGLERTLRTANREPFTEAEAANQNARVAALRGMAGPDAAGDAAGKFVAGRLAQLHDLEAALDKSGRETAQRVADQLGGNPGAMSEQDLGAAHQAALDALRVPVKKAASALFDTIDPDGTKALGVKSIVGAAKQALSEVNPRMGGSLSGDESGVLAAAAGMRPVELFSDVRALDSNLSAAQRAIRNNPQMGAESPAYRRVTMVRNAVDAAMVDAAADGAKTDAALAGAGQKAPGETAGEKFAAQHENVAGSSGVGTGEGSAGAEPGQAGRPGVSGGQDRGQAGPAGGPGRAATDRGVAAETATIAAERAAPRVTRSQEFKDWFGSSKIVGADGAPKVLYHGTRTAGFNEFKPSVGGEFGPGVYLTDDPSTADFYATNVARGEGHPSILPVYASLENPYRVAKTDWIRMTQRSTPKAVQAKLGRQGYDGIIGVGINGSDEQIVAFKPRQVRSATAGWKSESAAETPTPAASGTASAQLAPNFTAADRAALRERNAVYQDYKQTWRKGPVGDVIASGSTPSGFKMPAAQVAKTLFRPGTQGATSADALIKAAGSPEEAAKVLGDYPAYAFRRAAEKDGMIDPKAADKWIAAHKDTLGKFPGMGDRFSTAAKATQAWQDAAAKSQEQIKAFQDSALGHYLSKSGEAVEPQVAMGKLFASATGPADARAMVMAMAGDQAATDGLKRNLVDYLIQRTRSTAEAGTTGEKEIAGAAFQKIAADPKQAAVIRAVLGDEGAAMVAKIAKDIEAASRAVNATKIPGSPGSAADLIAHQAHSGKPLSVLGQVALGEAAGELLGHATGLGYGFGTAVGTLAPMATIVLQQMRNAGLRDVDDLTRQAVLQPELARLLLSKVQVKPGSPILKTLGARIGQIGLSAASQESR